MFIDSVICREFPRLTSAQAKVVELMQCGLTSKEMARELGVSPSAIDQRVLAIKRRVGVHSRRDLMRLYSKSDRPVLTPDERVQIGDAVNMTGSFDAPRAGLAVVEQISETAIPVSDAPRFHRRNVWAVACFFAGFFSGIAVATASCSVWMVIILLRYMSI